MVLFVLFAVPLKRRVSAEQKSQFKRDLEYQRVLHNENSMPFEDNELTDGIISSLCNYANRISKMSDIDIIVPGLSHQTKSDVYEIFEGIFVKSV